MRMNVEKRIRKLKKVDKVDGKQILEILDRAFRDDIFCTDLLERGKIILNNYTISREAKAAILSGDFNWIKKNVGELTSRQSKYFMHKLEM